MNKFIHSLLINILKQMPQDKKNKTTTRSLSGPWLIICKSVIIIVIYCRHMVHIVGTGNNAWAQKMVSHNSVQNRCWHIITRTEEKQHF